MNVRNHDNILQNYLRRFYKTWAIVNDVLVGDHCSFGVACRAHRKENKVRYSGGEWRKPLSSGPWIALLLDTLWVAKLSNITFLSSLRPFKGDSLPWNYLKHSLKSSCAPTREEKWESYSAETLMAYTFQWSRLARWSPQIPRLPCRATGWLFSGHAYLLFPHNQLIHYLRGGKITD